MRKYSFLVLVVIGLTGIARAQDDPRAVVTKAIKAQGGEEKLTKIRAGRSKLKGTLYDNGREIAFTGEEVFALPNQIRITLVVKTTPKGQSIVEVFDGDKGWISQDGQVKDADSESLARLKQQAYLSRVIWLIPLLNDKEFKLSMMKEVRARDRALVGVRVASKDQKDIGLYFDKETGLLVRLDYTTKNAQGREVTQEDSFSDFVEVSGVKTPKKSVAVQDGKKLIELVVTEVEFPESIPAKEFSKP